MAKPMILRVRRSISVASATLVPSPPLCLCGKSFFAVKSSRISGFLSLSFSASQAASRAEGAVNLGPMGSRADDATMRSISASAEFPAHHVFIHPRVMSPPSRK
jgi:hypothetical protein